MKPKKKVILISMVIIVSTILIILPLKDYNSLNEKVNTNNEEAQLYNKKKGIIEEKTVDYITISDIICKTEKDTTTLNYKITNNSNEDLPNLNFKILFKDKNNELMETMLVSVPIVIKQKSSITFQSSTPQNLNKAEKIEIELEEN